MDDIEKCSDKIEDLSLPAAIPPFTKASLSNDKKRDLSFDFQKNVGFKRPCLDLQYMPFTSETIDSSVAISDSQAINNVEIDAPMPMQRVNFCEAFSDVAMDPFAETKVESGENLTAYENMPGTSTMNAATAIAPVLHTDITEEEINELIEGLGDDIDLMLDERAEKNKLTVRNVKSILKHVITNKYVLAMVRNTMRSENNEDCELEEAVFEPKLTRSKAKELREKQGMLPWPVSTPVKQNKRITNKLLFEDFSEEEGSSDEEYRPNDEELHSGEEDGTSVKTSVESVVHEDRTKDTVVTLSESGDKQLSGNQDDRIALRTRSKLPLTDTPLEKIEASFIAPDITIDMYDTLIDDEEWQKFLSDFSKPIADEKDNSEQPDDDGDDPEYNVMDDGEADPEDDPEEEEGVNDTSAVVTKEEMNALMSEILMEELVQIEDEGVDHTNNDFVSLPSVECPGPITTTQPNEQVNAWMTGLEKLQLEMQMRMHVQLLTQSFLLSHDMEAFSEIHNNSATFLEELKLFSTRETRVNPSTFQAINLDEAISIVKEFKSLNIARKEASYFVLSNKKLSQRVKETIAFSKVFMYSQLLPHVAYQEESNQKNSKVIFTRAEDNLIVLGLDQFEWSQNRFKLVQSYLVTAKTEQQIRFRAKNRRSAGAPEDNPIKRYFKYNELPEIKQVYDQRPAIAPCNMSPAVLPPWMVNYITRPPLVNLAPQPVQTARSSDPIIRIQKRIPKRNYYPILPRGYVSPLKKISPILRKYGHHRRILHMSPYNGTMIAAKPNVYAKTNHRPIKPKLTIPEEDSTLQPAYQSLMPPCDLLSSIMPILTADDPEVVFVPAVEACTANLHPVEVSQKTTSTSTSPTMSATDFGGIPAISVCNKPDENVPKEIEKEAVIIDLDAPEDGDEDDEDLAALMAASSTICRKNSVMKKKNKHQRDLESTLALLSPTLMDSDPKKEERENLFAQSYLVRVIEALRNEPENCENFLKLLCSYEYSNKSTMQLFAEVNEILKDHPTLVDDFVGFLLPEQARDCGKFLQYRMLCKIRAFLRKLEVHFIHQPQQIQRILRAFGQLQQQSDITSATVIAALQPLLRNQSHLLEEFVQLLPDSAPPECLMTDFEEIQIPNSDSEATCDGEENGAFDNVEDIVLPETPDPYGGKDCPCTCHTSTTDIRMQNRNRHCTNCGTKFLDGRIYIQTGKVLKPAQVVYHEPEVFKEQNRRRNALAEAAKTENSKNSLCLNSTMPSSSTTNISKTSTPKNNPVNFKNASIEKPVMECSVQHPDFMTHCQRNPLQEDNQLFLQSSTVHHGITERIATETFSPLPCDVMEDAVLLADSRNTSSSIPSDFSCISQVISPSSDSSNFITIPQGYQLISTVITEPNTEISAYTKLHVSSAAQQPVRMQTAMCPSPGSSITLPQEPGWTREQDKLILETYQKHGISTEAFAQVAVAIPSKSIQQLQNRFYELIELVKKHLNSSR